jgi:EcsC protein family
MSTLTDYEAEQVREIALWKSERPSLLLESYRTLIRPLSKLVARVVPKDLAKDALKKVESVAEGRAATADIIEAAGISAIPDLLNRSLDECDRLSRMVSARAEHLALLEGVVPAATGVALPEGGGAVAAVLDVPVLLEASVRAIRRIGHCYGFPLDSESDRHFVLGILDVANQDTPGGREEVREGIWDQDGPAAMKRDDSDAAQAIEESVVDDLPIESVPIVGDVANLVLDYAFVRRVDATARRVFQERWLRANDKVESIPPAAVSHRRSSIEGIAAVASELAYTGAYGVSFGVTFPVTLAALAVESVAPETVLKGFRDGASAASGDSREFLHRLAKAGGAATSGDFVPAASG